MTEPIQPAPRYTVRTEGLSDEMSEFGLRACVIDARHPDYYGAPGPASCAWCDRVSDAERIAAALNRDELFRHALRAMLTDTIVGQIENGEGEHG
jgi:hypothetical protein